MMNRLRPVPKPERGRKRKPKVAPSIMQTRKECYVTGANHGLQRHEVFFGKGKRQLSLEWGCWVYLRWDWHTSTNYSVHLDSGLNKRLKKETQKRFEEIYGRKKFTEVFGKNYLED